MDTIGITKLIVAILLSINSGLCHVVSYPGHLTGGAHLGHLAGGQLGHLSGAHLGLHRLPVYHLGKVVGPAVLSSSSSVLRQIYSEPYYPGAGYPAYPQYGEYAPYPVYPQYPEYGQNQVAQFLPESNQQVPPNASVSKLPPILEGFVQRIQNLLSHYNPANHNEALRPATTFLQTPNRPVVTNLGWPPQYVFAPTYTDQKAMPQQGGVSPTTGVNPSQGAAPVQPLHPSVVGVTTLQPLHPSVVGVTTLQPLHPTLAVTPLHPLQPSFGIVPQHTIPPPTQVIPEQPIATQRPQPAVTPSTTPSPSTIASNNNNNVNPGPDNIGANGEQGPNTFGLLPNRPPSFVPATQIPSLPNNNNNNNNQGNVANNNKHNVQTSTSVGNQPSPPPTHGAILPGTFANVPQTTPPTTQRTPQPQNNNNNNKHVPASVDFAQTARPQPQPQQPINGSPPSFSAYGAPDPLTLNQVGSQRPPTRVTSSSSPGVSYTIHSLTSTATGLQKTPFDNNEYGAPDPFSSPAQQGNRHQNSESLQTFGRSSQTREIIALIQQYGLLLNGEEGGGRPEKVGASNSFSGTPLGSLSAPQQIGARYNYNQPAKPFRYPPNYN